ncbi:unnamed protein product [Cunninghamella echinulata]
MIQALMKHRRAVAFLQPVDVVAFNIPDYLDIVKQPMDFGTISTKLQNNEYETVDAFLDDIRLVFHNCFLYNHAQDPVSLDAKKLEEVFNKWLLKRPEPQQISVDDVPIMTNTVEPIGQNDTLKQNNSINIDNNYNSSSNNNNNDSNTLDQLVIMPDKDRKICEGALKELNKHKKLNWPFLQPVDADAWGATDYYQIITQPMDMSTIEKKLNEFEYANAMEFEHDVKLMFRNCYTYNLKEHSVYQSGEKLEGYFDKYWKKAHKKEEAKGVQKGSKKLKVVVERKQDTKQVDPVNNEVIAPPPPPPPPTEEARPPTILRLKLTAKPKEVKPKTSPSPSTTPPSSTSPLPPHSIHLQQQEQLQLQQQQKLQQEHDQRLEYERQQQKQLSLQQQQQQYQQQHQQQEIKPIKISGLALSKEPPNDIGRPKLAIGNKTTSPVRDKRSEKKAPLVLQNHDKWLALAQKAGSGISESESTTTSPPNISSSTSIKLKESTPASIKPFNINELFDRIQGENRVREQEKREEESLRLKSERILMEKKQQSFREQEERRKEHQEWMEIKRKKDRAIREAKLTKHPLDISKQKLAFCQFESNSLNRDPDWRELYMRQRDTIEYRRMPAPNFVKKASSKLEDLRDALARKATELRFQANNNNNNNMSSLDMDLS